MSTSRTRPGRQGQEGIPVTVKTAAESGCLNGLVVLVALFCFGFSSSFAELPSIDLVGNNPIVICSQNLENLGSLTLMKQRDRLASVASRSEKINGLVERFHSAACDVIALQELLGSQKEGQETGRLLARAIFNRSKRRFKEIVGVSNDPSSGVGFLFDQDKFRFESSYAHVSAVLPKLTFFQRMRRFIRAPLELRLSIKSPTSTMGAIRLITFHFKSKSTRSGQDLIGLKYEDWRMESAEALRRIAIDTVREREILVLLGDRNSDMISASARILEGRLWLEDFKRKEDEQPLCKVSEEGLPYCQTKDGRPPVFSSVFENNTIAGSFFYRGRGSWLDDILLPVEQLSLVAKGSGSSLFSCGVVTDPPASDHSLVFVKLYL